MTDSGQNNPAVAVECAEGTSGSKSWADNKSTKVCPEPAPTTAVITQALFINEDNR